MLKVFKSAPVAANPAPAAPVVQTEQLQRLAESFKVDSGADLIKQLMDHQCVAQADQVLGEPAVASWQRALNKTQATSRRRRVFKADALSALLHWVVVPPSSSTSVDHNNLLSSGLLGNIGKGTSWLRNAGWCFNLPAPPRRML
ncbi:MAG: hypothetical protein ACKPKO_53415, partial [Candidatus Fonsibacter sp.]